VFEDIPLFILNVQVTSHLGAFSFVSSVSLALSLLGILKKGRTISQWIMNSMCGDDGGSSAGSPKTA
jgi:hypothetical protein